MYPMASTIRNKISSKIKELKLDFVVGCSNQNYPNIIPTTSTSADNSVRLISQLFVDDIFPTTKLGLSSVKDKDEEAVLYVLDGESMKSLYEGNITVGDVYEIDSYNNKIVVIRNIPTSDIKTVLFNENDDDDISSSSTSSLSNRIEKVFYVTSILLPLDKDYYTVVTTSYFAPTVLAAFNSLNPSVSYSSDEINATTRETFRLYIEHCMKCGNIKVGNCTIYDSEGKINSDTKPNSVAMVTAIVLLVLIIVVGFGIVILVMIVIRCKGKDRYSRMRRGVYMSSDFQPDSI